MNQTRKTRDDFATLDDYSYGRCIDILEEYEEARMEVNAFLNAINPDRFEPKALEALSAILSKLGNSQKVELRRAILNQIRNENGLS